MRVLDDISGIDAVVLELVPQPDAAGRRAADDEADQQSADRNGLGGGSERSSDGRNEEQVAGEDEQRVRERAEREPAENDFGRVPDPPAPDDG
jgi:hypothetical protein